MSEKASAAARFERLKVRLLILAHQDYKSANRLVDQMDRLGAKIGAPGMVQTASRLRLALYREYSREEASGKRPLISLFSR